MPVPFSFGAATTAIPLSQLDSNFNTPITLGNTAIQLGNTVTTLNNMTLANVTISSGNVTITNVTVTTANATTVNTTTLIATTTNVTTINATDINVATSVTLNGGTANGVAYLNGSKVLTTGSALTFDGTNLGVGNIPAANTRITVRTVAQTDAAFAADNGVNTGFKVQFASNLTSIGNDFNNPLAFLQNNTEQMRLTSTGLGIGTSSPVNKLVVSNAGAVGAETRLTHGDGSTAGASLLSYNRSGSAFTPMEISGSYLKFSISDVEKMRLDSSGNLGLGVTPSAWGTGKAIEVGAAGNAIWADAGYTAILQNVIFSSGAYRYVRTASAARIDLENNSFKFYTAPSGTAGNAISFTQALTLDANQNLLLNGTTAGASAVGTLAIFNGTAPTGSVTNGIILYAEDVSSSSELKVRDEAGNVTTLSPHNFSLIPEGPSEEMAWAYYSEKGGKRINVDMLKLARMVEKLTGEKLVYES